MNILGAKELVGLNFFAESVNGWLRKLQQHEAPIFKDLAQRTRERVRKSEACRTDPACGRLQQ
jgi:hypothetical protein